MRRVVITGIGIVSPLGNNAAATWNGLIEGKSGIAPITQFDATNFSTRIAGEVKDFKPAEHGIDEKEAKRMDRFQHFCLATAIEAVRDSGIDFGKEDHERTGASIGIGFGGIVSFEAEHAKYMQNGPRRISPFIIPQMIANLGPGYVSINFGLKGPQACPVAACATGTFGVIEGYRLIKEGIADIMLSGGVEAAISPMSVGGFCSMKALSSRNEEPTKASRPFDAGREGFVPAEGGATLVLEELEHAKARGAKIYAEVVGWGSSSDAFHITQPAPGGEGGYRAMKYALASAGIKPEQVQYINAHGTSTPFNDKLETAALKRLYGDHAKNLKISSTKSMTGHLLGGAGSLEAAVTALSIYNKKVHGTMNYETPDPECDLDYVPNKAQSLDITYAMSNSFGFGGVNGVLVLGKY